jgi:hypothetical protein
MIYYNDSTDFPGGQQQFVEDYEPSAGQMFKIGFGAGLDDTTLGLLTSISAMDAAENAPVLTKEDWEASKFYDPEIKWDDSFTTPKARLLKERRDRERELGFLLERAGIGSTAAFYGGAIAGTVPDIVNYIPFVGIASKAKSAAVLGKIAQSGRLGRGATTAADAVLGTALIQPLVAAERDTYQLKYDTRDALTELGLALGLGFGLGAALGRVHPKDRTVQEVADRQRGQRVTPDGETTPDNLPPEPTNTRAQQDWDSVAPTDKVEAVRRKIANDAVGTQDNVPIVRQQGAQQAIAQEAARLEAIQTAFKDSQIVNADGTPRVMYHGTGSDITAFDLSGNTRGGLIYFTSQTRDASGYAVAKGSNSEMTIDFEILADKYPDIFDVKTGKVLNARKLKKALEDTPSNYLDAEDIADIAKRDKIPFAKAFERLFESNYRGGNVIPVYINAKKVLGSEGSPAMGWQEAEKLGAKHFTDQGYDAVWIREGEAMKDSLAIFDPKIVRSIYSPAPQDFTNAQLIADSTWNTPRPAPEPLPAPDDTPISANEARLQQMEAALDERIRTAEANGTLSETDARELAYIDEEIVKLDKYHQAVSETIECVIANG